MTVQISTLPNGLNVVTETMPHLETVSLGVWVAAGSRHERPEENGISHMLEHMAFKGTERRTGLEIAEAIENVGGDINAATSLEMTSYYARILKDDAPLAIDVLADILQNSTFEAEELAREKDVILQEIAACHDSPDDLVFDTAQDLAFAGQAAGRSILGTPDTLESFSCEGLKAYLGKAYVPQRMVVSAAGAISHEALLGEVAERFGALVQKTVEPTEPAHFVGGTRTIERPVEQTHLVLGFEAPALGTPSYYTAQVFAGVLGGGMSSRLFQKAREERGLCYSIYAYCWAMMDSGLFGIYAGTSDTQVEEMHDVIRGELEDLASNGPTSRELGRAKAQMKAGLLMGLESSSMRAEQMARHLLLYGHVISPAELIKCIDAVDRDAIRRYAGDIVNAKSPVWAEIGPARRVRRAGSAMSETDTRQTVAEIV